MTFEFIFGELDNRSMVVQIEYDGKTELANKDNCIVTLTNVVIPNSIKLCFSGKRANKDTIVDANDNVVKDMYTKIAGIKMDCIRLPDWVIQKKLSYTTEKNALINSSYIGFNGEMIIDIPESNVFAFYSRITRDNSQ